MFGKKKFELESVRRQKSAEVDAMMRLHGVSFRDACRKVALHPTNYVRGEPPIAWLPSPEQIKELAMAFKRGNVIVNGQAKRLPDDATIFEPDHDEPDELADVIPEPFEMPVWFNA